MVKKIEAYVECGAPTKIYHGEYEGVLVDIQPLNDGLCCGIYRFRGGDSIGGPTVETGTLSRKLAELEKKGDIMNNKEMLASMISTALHIEAEHRALSHKEITDTAGDIRKCLTTYCPVTEKEWEEILRGIARYADCLI